jgi:hypothetical protein
LSGRLGLGLQDAVTALDSVVPFTKRITKNFAAHGTLVEGRCIVGKESVYARKGDDSVTWVGKVTLVNSSLGIQKKHACGLKVNYSSSNCDRNSQRAIAGAELLQDVLHICAFTVSSEMNRLLV